MSTDNKVGTADLLFARAQQMGLQPAWLTRNGLFAVTTDSGEKYINLARSTLNSQMSASLATNKYLTRLILERHKLPNIPYAHPATRAEAREFLARHHKIIVKPLKGLGSRDIHIVDRASQLAGINIDEYIFEKYIAGKEMRYLILNGQVIAVHQSEYGVSVHADRALERISYPHTSWNPRLVALSIKIAAVLGLQFAAVDFLIERRGRAYVLEVNSMPGLKWFHAPSAGPPVDVAQLFFEAMLADAH